MGTTTKYWRSTFYHACPCCVKDLFQSLYTNLLPRYTERAVDFDDDGLRHESESGERKGGQTCTKVEQTDRLPANLKAEEPPHERTSIHLLDADLRSCFHLPSLALSTFVKTLFRQNKFRPVPSSTTFIFAQCQWR